MPLSTARNYVALAREQRRHRERANVQIVRLRRTCCVSTILLDVVAVVDVLEAKHMQQ